MAALNLHEVKWCTLWYAVWYTRNMYELPPLARDASLSCRDAFTREESFMGHAGNFSYVELPYISRTIAVHYVTCLGSLSLRISHQKP